jgi:hypothetical protein
MRGGHETQESSTGSPGSDSLSSFLYFPASAARSSALSCTMHHTVKSDETKKIAKKYNVSWRWLAVINDLSS